MTAGTSRTSTDEELMAELLSPQFIEDPYPTLDRLRERGPLFYLAFPNHSYVLDHDTVDEMLRSRAYSHDAETATEGTLSRLLTPPERNPLFKHNMLLIDPPEHTRLRGLVNKAFTPRAVERMRPRVAAIAGALLDAVADRDEFDLMDAYAAPLPTIVIAEMLGVDPRDQQQFKAWSDQAAFVFDPQATLEQRHSTDTARNEMYAYLRRAIAERRAAPRDDLVSGLVHAQEGDERLSDDDIVVTCSLLLAAGNITTTDLIGNGVYALLSNSTELAKLRADPALIMNAVEEILRYDSPVMVAGRIPFEDMVLAGCPVAKGASLNPSLAAVNRDPHIYPEPDRFDITRTDTHHHSFGGGMHFCLGAPLARLEGQVAVSTLVQRFPGVRLAQGRTPTRRHLPFFRGFSELWVAV